MDCTIVIAGSAGEGVQTIGDVLADTLAAHGYGVFAWQEYESRIRGGQNSFTIRVTDPLVSAPTMEADILLYLNAGAMEKYRAWCKPEAILVGETAAEGRSIVVPFKEMARSQLGRPLYANTLAMGALAAVAGLNTAVLDRVLTHEFASKGEDAVQANLKAAALGYDHADRALGDQRPWSFPQKDQAFYLISGNESLAVGAFHAGCRFMAAYPMTPSTGIIRFLAQHWDKTGIFCEQAEDEIAAINMALGASFAGVRSMTATSGGGFALMVEAVSLSGMTEVPVVIVLAQRPGPATGLPTRTAQGDLLFAVHAGHGEFPKAVLAPSDPREAVHVMGRAFDLADRFQIPVIVLSDQLLADARFSVDDFRLEDIVRRCHLADPKDVTHYQRYALTDTGVSPRLYPGQGPHLVTADSDEHDEWGHITEDLTRTAPSMLAKRLKKGTGLQQAMKAPEAYGLEDAEEIFCTWGSARGAALEAVEALRRSGVRVGLLHWTDLWPPPATPLPEKGRLWTVENNAGGQWAALMALAYGRKVEKRILRSDGLPLTAAFIRRAYHELA
ncbi:2-oxoacid:acceptor oxidoreductase subunit alpha [Desulfoglaeba alkanexedens]|jgi:2-oxoglutarate ferredoxin oxidoreductase subunit alpha|uniref:2-oxoacid:acceptor oxidoreductase subunit alpha n=1 Tax=Desulfoglaeba alkanexedens ALDC TaxID=980445 RepID=A0A4P8L5B4_9BACT|nr:2-oxoacid:acceptor oxidoreductase subunit alpha [Desulfoglaeba alkanexedens]QCQ23100.1 2-oxoacid:acceptor oxidoreductase subunit alpha [Desulfoglaeba alkanexedens ALDC]